MHVSRQPGFTIAVLLIFSSLTSLSIASAQTDSLSAPQEVEYDMGIHCPVSSVLDSTGTILWVLMNSCFYKGYYLQGFDVANGAPINTKISSFEDELSELSDEDYVATNETPMVFTPDGLLEILYYDDNYDPQTFQLSLDPLNGAVTAPSTDSLNTLLRSFSEFPKSTVYNADHTRAVAFGETSLHVLDLIAGSELLEIQTGGEAYNSLATFSADGNRLYAATLNNPDDMQDYTSVLNVYSLPDGKVLNTYDMPSPFLYVSPDEKYVVASLGEADEEAFVLIELATGGVSEAVRVHEGQSRVTQCANDGRDMSDVDFTTSGRLPIMDLEWLPDSSGFLTVHSYLGESAGGGAPCYFNHSRLRSYTLQ